MTVDFLKKILLLDAAVCAAIFAVDVLFTAQVSAALGLAPVYVAAGGWICLGAAILLGYAGTRAVPPALLVWLIVFLNVDWVIASVVVFEIEFANLTALGKVVLLGQAAATLAIAAVEAGGARMLGHRPQTAAA
ncbi:MAG: hypothetical protein ABR601_06845 [Parasphingopyxis sp.]|nr:hypothetical protein [Sphingomonadales bacterium]